MAGMMNSGGSIENRSNDRHKGERVIRCNVVYEPQ
jgi:hypothetical protein